MGRSAKPERRVQLPFAHPIGSSGSNGQAPDFYSGLCGFESCLERQTWSAKRLRSSADERPRPKRDDAGSTPVAGSNDNPNLES